MSRGMFPAATVVGHGHTYHPGVYPEEKVAGGDYSVNKASEALFPNIRSGFEGRLSHTALKLQVFLRHINPRCIRVLKGVSYYMIDDV